MSLSITSTPDVFTELYIFSCTMLIGEVDGTSVTVLHGVNSMRVICVVTDFCLALDVLS